MTFYEFRPVLQTLLNPDTILSFSKNSYFPLNCKKKSKILPVPDGKNLNHNSCVKGITKLHCHFVILI